MFRAVLASLTITSVFGITRELYTTNAVCKQNYCINPIFPGLAELPELTAKRWAKHSLENISSWLGFCAGVVDYDPALPVLNKTSMLQTYLRTRSIMRQRGELSLLMEPTEEMVRSLDKQALKTYFYHLSGMGIEAWDHPEPLKHSSHPLQSCARAVARLSCFTYFPRAYSGLPDGSEMGYSRPCKNACESYIQACDVDCCDDSVTCTWDAHANDTARKTTDITGKAVLLDAGYIDVDGPSHQCTGAA
uniref:Phospholipase B-like n=1 Tax=Pyrodinium bahamense TaxID=73915 RepID=A0A7S0FKY2_9DINO|mmetsp:Transcript_36638/g.101753  ORF Transcript_36638/g.101753 Transcript_36638/m.101753 type:complete len:248 (+) Transcript_36638:154-897(+)